MMTFANFEPGKALGRREFHLTEEMIGLWTGLFPDDRRSLPFMPPAMIAVVVMRAFIEILPDRPRGNVHAGQKFWISRLPQLQDRMMTSFLCLGKEEKGNRRWLTFRSDTLDTADQPLFRGQMTTIWAA